MLTTKETPAFESVEGSADRPILFVCDHASNRIPEALGGLGLEPEHLVDHIAWDIGAGAVAHRLRDRFDGSAVFASYSRLVVDLNRAPTDASLIPCISDSVLVPANLSVTSTERQERIETLFEPYHAEVDRLVDGFVERGQSPAFLGIHSFTSHFHRLLRPWHIGILWDKDPRLAVPMLQYLRSLPGVCIGDNEPYSGRHPADYSIDHHAEARGLAHVGIEIRQDLIGDEEGQARWAGYIGDALEFALQNRAVFEPFSGRRAA